jgi:hypothetical protein
MRAGACRSLNTGVLRYRRPSHDVLYPRNALAVFDFLATSILQRFLFFDHHLFRFLDIRCERTPYQ